MIVVGKVAKAGWFLDDDGDRIHLADSEIRKVVEFLPGAPITVDDHPVWFRFDRHESVGVVLRSWFHKGAAMAEIDLWNPGQLAAQTLGSLSMGAPGEIIGDEFVVNGIDHVALCRKGRIDGARLHLDNLSWKGWVCDSADDGVRMDSGEIADAVNEQLKADYKSKDRLWVLDTDWTGPSRIPLDQIDWSGRKGWQASSDDDEDQVDKFARRLKTGWDKPIILVKHPGNDLLFCVDGHHRLLAYRKLDADALAYVGTVTAENLGWVGFHDKQKSKEDSDEERDPNGKWISGPGGSVQRGAPRRGPNASVENLAENASRKAVKASAKATEHPTPGNHDKAAAAHEAAADAHKRVTFGEGDVASHEASAATHRALAASARAKTPADREAAVAAHATAARLHTVAATMTEGEGRSRVHASAAEQHASRKDTRRFDFSGGSASLAAPVRTANGWQFEGIAARVHTAADPLRYPTQADGLRFPNGEETRDLEQTTRLAQFLVGVPVVLGHDGEVLGKVLATRIEDGTVIATYSIKRPDAKDIVRELPELSAGYTADITDDGAQLIQGCFELALCTKGRCSSDQIACATRADKHEECGCEIKSACKEKTDVKMKRKLRGILGYTPPPKQGTRKSAPPTTPPGPAAAPDPNERPQGWVQSDSVRGQTTMTNDLENETAALAARSASAADSFGRPNRRDASGQPNPNLEGDPDPNDTAHRSKGGNNARNAAKVSQKASHPTGPWLTPQDCSCPHFPEADEEHSRECPLFVDPSQGLREVAPTHYAQKTNEAAASRAGRRRGDERIDNPEADAQEANATRSYYASAQFGKPKADDSDDEPIDSDDLDESAVAARALARSSDMCLTSITSTQQRQLHLPIDLAA